MSHRGDGRRREGGTIALAVISMAEAIGVATALGPRPWEAFMDWGIWVVLWVTVALTVLIVGRASLLTMDLILKASGRYVTLTAIAAGCVVGVIAGLAVRPVSAPV